jgi:hypothetical protein
VIEIANFTVSMEYVLLSYAAQMPKEELLRARWLKVTAYPGF